MNAPEPPPFATNQHAGEAVAEAGFAVRGFQHGRGECVHNVDVSKNVDVDCLPFTEGEPQVFELRRKCGEHRPDRVSARSDLSVTRPDEDDILGAKIQCRLEIPTLERLIECGQRIPHCLRLNIHAETVRRGYRSCNHGGLACASVHE